MANAVQRAITLDRCLMVDGNGDFWEHDKEHDTVHRIQIRSHNEYSDYNRSFESYSIGKAIELFGPLTCLVVGPNATGDPTTINAQRVSLYRTLHEHGEWSRWAWIETDRDSGKYRCARLAPGGVAWVNLERALPEVIEQFQAGPTICYEPLPKGLSV